LDQTLLLIDLRVPDLLQVRDQSLGEALRNRRGAGDSFPCATLLLWLAIGAIPAILSGEGVPHALRSVLMLPAVVAIAGIGAHRAWGYTARSVPNAAWRAAILVPLLLSIAWHPYHTYFDLWLNHPEVPGHYSMPLVNLAGQFFSWASGTVIELLEIIFSVVAPGVMPYIKKAQAAFRTILDDPIGFVGNLVKAGRLGFELFAKNIVEHLKAALIKWITGPLGDAGVYIPKSFDLIEIIKLVLSILGLTWQNIRAKLVKIIPDPVLVVLEKSASILVTLVKDGPVAAWEQIKAELSELKSMLISEVTSLVVTEIVKAAVTKVVSMINPAGAVIQAIIAIYNTVMFFVERITQTPGGGRAELVKTLEARQMQQADRIGKDLKDDPQYQARLKAGEVPAPKAATERPPLQPSVVHGLSSSQSSTVPPPQTPAVQVSAPLQTVVSAQAVPSPTFVCWQPCAASQESTVHGLLSLQSRNGPAVQTPL
jgi:hypothetical protein